MAPSPTSTKSRVKAINRAIMAEEKRVRAAHPWLRHQDAIGFGIFLASLAAIGGVVALYFTGILPWWLAIPFVALPVSLLHELEHDLIHDIYFKKKPGAQHLMIGGIWLSKMSMSGWTRRRLHLRHHRVSGQPIDIEERLIGLGMPLGPRRILITVLPAFAVIALPGIGQALKEAREARGDRPERDRGPDPRWLIPVRAISGGFALLPLVALPAALMGLPWAIHLSALYVLPNILRHTSIALISSYSHYYGDIPTNDVFYQNQILDHWLTWPLQLFCFNFGATHVLHHYVVRQPFYLRQWVSPGVRQALLDAGVRHNDLGTVRRANRWTMEAT